MRKLPFAQKPRHFNGCKRTWGTKTCIALPAEILPPVTRHNKLWNIQLLAISLPLMAVLPKGKHVVMLCCSEAPDWALPQHRPKKRKCVLPPHTEACALNLCALHPLRAKHLSGTHAVLLGRELPTCLELFSAFWGTDRGWSPNFFLDVIEKNRTVNRNERV